MAYFSSFVEFPLFCQSDFVVLLVKLRYFIYCLRYFFIVLLYSISIVLLHILTIFVLFFLFLFIIHFHFSLTFSLFILVFITNRQNIHSMFLLCKPRFPRVFNVDNVDNFVYNSILRRKTVFFDVDNFLITFSHLRCFHGFLSFFV